MALTTFQAFSMDTWKSWDKTGKLEVLKKVQLSVKDKADAKQNLFVMSSKECEQSTSKMLYEIVCAVVRGLLRKDYAKAVLTEILSWHPDMASLLTEVFSLVEFEVTTVERLSKQRDQLISLIKLVNLDKVCAERLEIETLGDAGIIKNKKNFLTKQIKARTKLYYKQHKFNLLREESEGYSKLVTELNQELSDTVDSKSIIHVIRSLIGCFNLDPNRVLDHILEAFEGRPEEYEFFIELLREFPHEVSTIIEILHFKLQNAGTPEEDMKHVFVLMGLLAKSGILSLDDVYNMLTPDDSLMIAQHEKWMEEAKTFCKRAMIVSTKDKDDSSHQLEEKPALQSTESNQKISFLVALLEIGSWDHFVSIASRFPSYYITSWQPVASTLCKFIHYLIDPISQEYSELPNRIKKKPLETYNNIVMDKPVKTFSELMADVFPMISMLGPYIYHDLRLMFKVLRLCRSGLKKELNRNKHMHGAEYYEVMTIMNDSLLPALSMIESNPCIAEEVWETIKFFEYQHRYNLYHSWKNETYTLHPMLMVNRSASVKKITKITKRVTQETVKPTSRHLGKVSHNFPGPVLEYVLKQVQLYDNLIGPIMESFKCLTSLSFDVLAFCIVEIFCSTTERIQDDGLAISRMLQTLSNFSGSVCKKYPIDISGLLQYVANQLKCGKSIDLLLLKNIVQKMGGAEFIDSPTSELLDAMCGGEILRREAGQYMQEKNIRRSSVRLKEVLLENNLAIPLLLLMAQQRSSIAYNETETPHLKLVGNLYDQCQSTMVQFGTFISQVVTIEELTSKLPCIYKLLSEYHIDTDVAFFLSRPMTSHLLQIKYDEFRKRDKGEKNRSASDDRRKIFLDACKEVYSPIGESIRPHYSSKFWEDIDPNFFVTFWALSMSDLEIPVEAYDKEIKKLADLKLNLAAPPKMLRRRGKQYILRSFMLKKHGMIDVGISEMKSAYPDEQRESPNSRTRKKEVEKINALKDKLEDEKKKQIEHVERMNSWLMQEKDHWFKIKSRAPQSDSVVSFLQNCVFPRCKFTTLDAIYCARFIRLVHDLKTPSFSTLLHLDKLFIHTSYILVSCTEQEAQHYGRFLLEMLETIKHWHSSKDIFEKECSLRPGFMTRYRQSPGEENRYIEYEEFRNLVHKWHYKITKAMSNCLESGDYIQIRNAIFVLQGIWPCFPVITNVYAVIEKRIQRVLTLEKDKRRDLFALAKSYWGRLKAKKSKLVPESEFHIPPRHKAEERQNNEAKKKENAVNGNDSPNKGPDDGSRKAEKRPLEVDENQVRPEKRKKEKKEDKTKEEKSKKKKEVKKKPTDNNEESPTANGSIRVTAEDETKGTKRRKLDSDKQASSPQDDRSKKRKTPHSTPEPDTVDKKERKDKKRPTSPMDSKRRSSTRKTPRLH